MTSYAQVHRAKQQQSDAANVVAGASNGSASLGAATEQKLEEMEDQLESVTRSQDKLSAQLTKLLSDHNSHCHDVSTVYQNVSTLLNTTSSLTDAYRSLDEKLQGILHRELAAQRAVQQAQHEQFEGQVRRLLENFKEEIIGVSSATQASLRDVSTRVQDMESRVIRLEESFKCLHTEHHQLSDHVRGNVETKLQTLDKSTAVALERMDSALSTSKSTQEQLASKVDGCVGEQEAFADSLSHCVDTLQKFRQEVQAALSRVVKRVDTNTAEVAEAARDAKEAKAFIDLKIGHSWDAIQAKVETSAERVASLDRALSTAHHDLTNLSKRVEATSQRCETMLAEAASSTARAVETLLKPQVSDQLKKLETDLDKRHKKLVESTHQALTEISKANDSTPALLQSLQQELQQVRETLHLHSVAIDAQRMEGNMETAFTELKDWLQDVERRMIGRSEVEEMVNSVSSQLQLFKQHSMSIETLLGKRLDAERAARETDVSHQSVQLQKLQTVLKR